jgi:Tfp pilus assembly protein FimV
MVYAIARRAGVKMPGFFPYMIWSGAILLPVFAAVTWLFLMPGVVPASLPAPIAAPEKSPERPLGEPAVQKDFAAAKKAPEPKLYTVKPGDTLWKIAETVYGPGHGSSYYQIFEANKNLLSKPRNISPGQKLEIPPLEQSAPTAK